jgi:UDPglucose 6-dehydrogenase
MKVSVIGTGYVGLVAGTCFAEYGNEVHCVDIDEGKIEKLKKGGLPIYEPGLEEMVVRNHELSTLKFTTDLRAAIQATDIIFIAVGTPDGGDGRPDLRGVMAVAETIGRHSNGYKIVVDKSTVPVGTAERVRERISGFTSHPFDVVSNPEFLREGCAIEDFMHPERVIIGSDSQKASEIMRDLYEPFVRDADNPILITNIRSAELTKYACNAFLAMKISFANEIANLCDTLGANYEDVKHGMGTDSRIGRKFLNAGIGYGGSCFPKDVRALIQTAGDLKSGVPLIEKVEETNESQKLRLVHKVKDYYAKKGSLSPDKVSFSGMRFAVWGLAFKPGTDDMREAPSIAILNALLSLGAQIAACDPVAEETSRVHFNDRIRYGQMYDVLDGADALLLLTEWPQFQEPDFGLIGSKLKSKLIFDGRNVYHPSLLKKHGFEYHCIGNR